MGTSRENVDNELKYKPSKYPRVVSYISEAFHALEDCSSIGKQTEGIQRDFSPSDCLEVLATKKKHSFYKTTFQIK